MRITVNIEPEVLRAVQKATGVGKKSPAIGQALAAYLRDTRRRRLIAKVLRGETDYAATNEELELRSVYDPH